MNAITKKLNRPRKHKPVGKVVDLYSYKVPNIVVIGDRSIRKRILQVEQNFNLVLLFCDHTNIMEVVNKKTIAIIVDEKKIGTKVKSVMNMLFDNYDLLPIFFLARKERKAAFYSDLYLRGLHGVVNWPRESKILASLIIESLKPHPKAFGKTKGDEKLADMVKSHLLLNGHPKGLKVGIINGIVFLQGSVNSLAQRDSIKSQAENVLGVQSVIATNLKIKKKANTTDKELERKIKMYIGHLLGDKKRSLTAKVKDMNVSLVGTVSGPGDIYDIEKFIKRQAGVQELERQVSYHPQLTKNNIKKARLLEKKILNIFDGVKHISIHLYKDLVEVSGTVKIKADRRLVQNYLLQVLPVKRVVNKLFVSKGR